MSIKNYKVKNMDTHLKEVKANSKRQGSAGKN